MDALQESGFAPQQTAIRTDSASLRAVALEVDGAHWEAVHVQTIDRYANVDIKPGAVVDSGDYHGELLKRNRSWILTAKTHVQ